MDTPSTQSPAFVYRIPTPESFLSKAPDMIAREVECRRDGIEGVFVVLEIPGLDALHHPPLNPEYTIT